MVQSSLLELFFYVGFDEASKRLLVVWRIFFLRAQVYRGTGPDCLRNADEWEWGVMSEDTSGICVQIRFTMV